MIKKLIVSIVVTVNLYASTGVLKQAANIRESAAIDSKIVTVLSKGTTVHNIKKIYTKNNGTWYKIDQGYVSIELINKSNISKAIKEPEVISAVEEPTKAKRKPAKVINNTSTSTGVLKQAANIRESAAIDSKIVTVLPKGTTVHNIKKIYTKNNGTWYKIDQGYVSIELINKSNTSKVIKQVKVIKEPEVISVVEEPAKVIEEPEIISAVKEPAKVERKQAKVIEEPIKVIKNTITSAFVKKHFIGMNLGMTTLKATQNNLTADKMILKNKPDTSGTSITLEAGEILSKNRFRTISYSYIKHDEVVFQNYLLSYNYRYNKNIYAGVVGGVSFIDITKSLVSGKRLYSSGKKMAYGVQIGYERKIKNNITLVAQYQFLKTGHNTALSSVTNNAELIRDNHSNITFGIRMPF